MQVNYDIAKIEYEIFHEDPEAIANRQGCPVSVINEAIKSWNWQHQNLEIPEDSLVQTNDLSSMLEAIKSRLKAQDILKQERLAPAYIRLELSILAKAQKIVDNLAVDTIHAAQELKRITEIHKTLLGNNGIMASTITDSGKEGTSLIVQIANKVDACQS